MEHTDMCIIKNNRSRVSSFHHKIFMNLIVKGYSTTTSTLRLVRMPFKKYA